MKVLRAILTAVLIVFVLTREGELLVFDGFEDITDQYFAEPAAPMVPSAIEPSDYDWGSSDLSDP